MGDISLRGKGRALMNKKRSAMKMGGMAMDEAREYAMENKKGKMIKKADMMTARMSKKKKGKIMRGRR